VRKSGVLHARLAALLTELGHTDTLVVADAGLPIPPGVERIDLALVPSVPGFIETLRAVLAELAVESAVVAEELAERSPAMQAQVEALLGDLPVQVVPHAELKRQTASARAVVRTGECTPYANIVLVAGVTF
jgi:D-ribose pyranase